MCTEVQHGTEEYNRTVALRDEVLRQPLGLQFSPKELIEERESFHLACWRDNRLVACVVMKPLTPRKIRMRQLVVSVEFQGKGIGRTLVSFSESFARGHGFEEIVLHARESAVGFYERSGYVVDGSRFIEVTIPHFPMRKGLVDRDSIR